MISPCTDHEIRFLRRTQDRRVVARPDGILGGLHVARIGGSQPKTFVTISAPYPHRSAKSRARAQVGSSWRSSAVLGLSMRKLATGLATSQRRHKR